MNITADMLRSKRACAEQVALFEELFGLEVVLTEALCVEHAGKFDWGWAAHYLLKPDARRAYNEAPLAGADRAYNEARAGAFARAALSQEGN